MYINYKNRLNITEPHVIITYGFFEKKEKNSCVFFRHSIFLSMAVFRMCDCRWLLMFRARLCRNAIVIIHFLFVCMKRASTIVVEFQLTTRQTNNIAQNELWPNGQCWFDKHLKKPKNHFQFGHQSLGWIENSHYSKPFFSFCCFLLVHIYLFIFFSLSKIHALTYMRYTIYDSLLISADMYVLNIDHHRWWLELRLFLCICKYFLLFNSKLIFGCFLSIERKKT